MRLSSFYGCFTKQSFWYPQSDDLSSHEQDEIIYPLIQTLGYIICSFFLAKRVIHVGVLQMIHLRLFLALNYKPYLTTQCLKESPCCNLWDNDAGICFFNSFFNWTWYALGIVFIWLCRHVWKCFPFFLIHDWFDTLFWLLKFPSCSSCLNTQYLFWKYNKSKKSSNLVPYRRHL